MSHIWICGSSFYFCVAHVAANRSGREKRRVSWYNGDDNGIQGSAMVADVEVVGDDSGGRDCDF